MADTCLVFTALVRSAWCATSACAYSSEVSKSSFLTRWQSMYSETAVMMLDAASSFATTQRVAWFTDSPSPFAASSVIWPIAFRTVDASSLRRVTRMGSSKMPHGT